MIAATINIQPEPNPATDGTNMWLASQRPVFFEVLADSIATDQQPMYADIYIGSLTVTPTFYKTVSALSDITATSMLGVVSVYRFDLQDAYQEYLKINPSPQNFLVAADTNLPYQDVQTFVKFRGSSYAAGLLVPQSPAPVQGTATTPPVSGTGLKSNVFTVMLATYSPQADIDNAIGLNQLETVLSKKQILYLSPWQTRDTRIYTLSNLPKNNYCIPFTTTAVVFNPKLCPEIYRGDSGLLPVLFIRFGIQSIASRTSRVCNVSVQFLQEGSTLTVGQIFLYSNSFSIGTYYLPIGLKEIEQFIGTTTLNSFLNTYAGRLYYRLIVGNDLTPATIEYISPVYRAMNTPYPPPTYSGGFYGGDNPISEAKRLWFQNYYGHYEQLTFIRNEEQLKVSASEAFTRYADNDNYAPYNPPGGVSADPTVIQTTGRRRYNIRMHEELSLKAIIPETLMPWVKELMSSPLCLLDTNGNIADNNLNPEVTQPNFATYNFLPYEIISESYPTKKTMVNDRWYYEVNIKIRPAIETVQTRN